MSKTFHDGHAYPPKQHQVITRHADVVVEDLPDGEFRRKALPDEGWLRTAFEELRRCGALEVVDQIRENGSRINVYLVPEETRSLAAHAIENREEILPCGHRGLQNRDGMLECRYPGCDERFDPEDVQEGDRDG